ncbi:MAG: DUF4097 family beta strand repeat-containing protein [Phycisphaerae bacterium]
MRRSTRSLIASLSLLLLAGCGNLVTAREDFAMDTEWKDYARVALRSTNGRLELVKGTGPKVVIRGAKQASALTMGEAQSMLARLVITAEPDSSDPTTLVIELDVPADLKTRSVGASILVEVPASVRGDLSTRNGSIVCKSMKDDVLANTSNGRITITDTDGIVRASTSNGGISIERATGSANVSTSNGAVLARDVKGDLTARTSNGSVEATGLGGSIDISTSNGRIEIAGAPGPEATISLTTSNGSIRATLPETIKGTLALSTTNGSLNTDLGKMSLTSPRMSKREMEATINGGGSGRIVMRSSNGSLTLNCR